MNDRPKKADVVNLTGFIALRELMRAAIIEGYELTPERERELLEANRPAGHRAVPARAMTTTAPFSSRNRAEPFP